MSPVPGVFAPAFDCASPSLVACARARTANRRTVRLEFPTPGAGFTACRRLLFLKTWGSVSGRGESSDSNN